MHEYVDVPEVGSVSLRRVLGSGRHGTVFLGSIATDTGPTDVAVKVAALGESLDDEANALVRFDHPNVIELLDQPSPTVIVVEHCAGGTLADRLGAPVPLDETARMIGQIASALHLIHGNGWIHGDVTASNVGLRADQSVALLDFATSRPADGKPLTQGTPDYAGPHTVAAPIVDVRCLARLARDLLGTPARWDVRAHAAATALDRLLDAADAIDATATEDAPTIDDVLATLDTVGPPARAARGDGDPPPPATRDYGPRPPSEPTLPDEGEPSSTGTRGALLVLFAAALVVVACGWAIQRVGTQPSPVRAAEAITAADTLRAESLVWHAATGQLETPGDNGPVLLDIGQSGDLAAVADWNCDGVNTLGVLRPDTMTWFEFSTWAPGATSTVRALDHRRVDSPALSVVVTGDGCAEPVVTAG